MRLPARPPDVDPLAGFESLVELLSAVQGAGAATHEYLPWDKLRWRTPPPGLTHEQWWAATKIARSGMQRQLPIRDASGAAFTYALPDRVLQLVDGIATRAGGQIGMAEPVTDPATRDRYVVRGLMEEAITSSQLEGASTTRRVAKEMLRDGRRPTTKGERMIVNNYRGMEFVRDHRRDPLTPALVLELHAVLTEGTLDDPGDAGRLQRPTDERVRVETFEGDIVHRPPPAEELPERLEALCAFANGPADDPGPWIHPVVRSVVVHFLAGFDHYFVDGNGRVARALFYWSMLHRGLWLTEFTTISTILKRAPAKYARSYLNSEYDGGDLTYFILYHLEVLTRAFDELESYLERKIRESQDVRRLVAEHRHEVNHRQLAILDAALRDPRSQFTIASHRRSHGVVMETARRDLNDLETRGLLVRSQRGRAFVWSPAPSLPEQLYRHR